MRVVMPNVAEFHLPLTERLTGSHAERWRSASLAVAGSSYFWARPGDLVLMPGSIGEKLLKELAERSGLGRLSVRWPTTYRRELSDWAGEILCGEEIPELFSPGRGRLEILAWGQTIQLNALEERLLQRGIEADCGVGGQDSLWMVRLAGSKCGLRHLAAGLEARGEVRMARGACAANPAEAAALADDFLARGKAAVIKPDRGVGGAAISLFDPSRPPRRGVRRHLGITARSFHELLAGPLVVEELVSAAGGGPVRSASAQCIADGAGGAKVLFLAEHFRGRPCAAGGFGSTGARLGKGVLEEGAGDALRRAALMVAEALSGLSLRGILGIDFAMGHDGLPRLLEVNPRRTTLTCAAALAGRLFGESWEESVSLFFLEQEAVAGRWEELEKELARQLFPCAAGGPTPSGWLPLPVPGARGREADWAGAIILSGTPGHAGWLARVLLARHGVRGGQ